MDKIIFYDREPSDHIPRWLCGLIQYFQNRNFYIELCHRKQIPNFKDCKLFFIWNGAEEIHKSILDKAKQENIKTLFVECGFFPQKDYYYIDEKGINADASIMNDDFSWIKQEHFDKLDIFRKKYLNDYSWKSPGKYILCPLQIDSDTNVIKNAPYKNMQSFIAHVEEKFPNDMILFKTHPVLANLNYKVGPNSSIIRGGNFLDIAQEAKLVYGQTSTALLESALMGVPTEAIGNCWLKQHKGNKQKLLAALIDKQIPVGENNLDYWIGKFLK